MSQRANTSTGDSASSSVEHGVRAEYALQLSGGQKIVHTYTIFYAASSSTADDRGPSEKERGREERRKRGKERGGRASERESESRAGERAWFSSSRNHLGSLACTGVMTTTSSTPVTALPTGHHPVSALGLYGCTQSALVHVGVFVEPYTSI
jgi:hypothetical protein